MKFNLIHVKAFYCNIKVYGDYIEHIFRDKVIKFSLIDFEHHFGLELKGNDACISNSTDFVREVFIYLFQNLCLRIV